MPPGRSHPAMPHSLVNVGHYYAPRGQHPLPGPLPVGTERVEVVTGGRGWVEHEGNWVEVRPGDLLWHEEGDWTIGRNDFDNPYRCLTVGLRVEPGQPRNLPRFSRWEDLEELRQFVRDVVRAYVDESIDRFALLAYIWGRLLYQVRFDQSRNRMRALPAELVRVLDRIENDYHLPLLLDDLAETADWSAAHLHDMFRLHLETSPHQMLIRRRLQAARERLAATNESIKRISKACGFTGSAAFCRTFRQATGLTPTTYRKRHSNPIMMTAE